MPLLDRVRVQTRSASTERASGALLMHHSRDTQQKQWTETCIHTLSAASKIFIAQRKALLSLGNHFSKRNSIRRYLFIGCLGLEDFGSAWEALLSYLEWAACYQNAELSLSAIKSFQVKFICIFHPLLFKIHSLILLLCRKCCLARYLHKR